MSHEPWERIFGVETEFGCLVNDDSPAAPEIVAEAIKDHLFHELRIGVLDHHARDDVFEPAESGGFLRNGGRLYIDAVGSHLEYATAESRTLNDLIANDRAGQRWIIRAIRELGLEEMASVYNNSVDHFGGQTFGCHENYLIRAEDGVLASSLPLFFGFLVTRQIFAGVGRVGGHRLTGSSNVSYSEMASNPVDYIWVSNVYGVVEDNSVGFQLSQRADHILKTVANRVRFNRALINPKWETMYAHEGMTRLHLLFGESNQNEHAFALKIGTTMLTIRALEEGLIGDHVLLAKPLVALRNVSRDETYRWRVDRVDGTSIGAVDLQRIYLQGCEHFRGESEGIDWILDAWSSILDGLESDPLSLGDRVDWVAKRAILEQYRASEGLEWGDDALHSIDLEYHNIDPEKSLFYALQEMGGAKQRVDELDILDAMTDPPQDTRAKGRSKLVEDVIAKSSRNYAFDWNSVAIGRARHFDMPDPFQTYENPTDQWNRSE